MIDSEELPAELPILTPANMYIGGYNGPDGTHCLSGWVQQVYGISPTSGFSIFCPLYEALRRQANIGEEAVSRYNDEHTKEQNADLWNRTAESLGYIQRDGRWVRSVKA